MSELSIQERLYPNLKCFGCGHANAEGLHLRSYETPEGIVASFNAEPKHDNGNGFVNGGILSTILDCHTAAVVLTTAHEKGWIREGDADLSFVTAGFDVRFLRPTPLGPALELFAKPESANENEMIVLAEVRYEEKVRVTMRATWKRFRPRPR
ncbi:MAG TPA: PaaI family thioesterase [Polyangiaceae bacterium]